MTRVSLTVPFPRRLSLLFIMALAALIALMVLPGQASAAHRESCQDILVADSSAADGDYTIFPNGQTFTVYCHDMASGTPREYLTLQNTGSNFNYSQYTAGGAVPGISVRTNYDKVRLDPDTLRIDIEDRTFSTSTGGPLTHGIIFTSMPYGIAQDCTASFSSTGTANIDLTGTPFTVNDSFVIEGFNAAGSVNGVSGTNPFPSSPPVISVTNQVVNLTGGGGCGWTKMSGAPTDPHLVGPDAFVLDLAYVGPVIVPVDMDIKPGNDPNSINTKSKGVIAVAILTTGDFDATSVNASTVLFGPDGAAKAHKRAHLEDVDSDGDTDMVFHFRTQETGITQGNLEACLTGETNGGQEFGGCDAVLVK